MFCLAHLLTHVDNAIKTNKAPRCDEKAQIPRDDSIRPARRRVFLEKYEACVTPASTDGEDDDEDNPYYHMESTA